MHKFLVGQSPQQKECLCCNFCPKTVRKRIFGTITDDIIIKARDQISDDGRMFSVKKAL